MDIRELLGLIENPLPGSYRAMPTPTLSARHHTIDYIEISVSDMAKSQRFYWQAFDWSFTDYGPEYAGIQGDGREMGGLVLAPTARRNGPLVVLFSSDLDSTLLRVEKAGGKITEKPFDFPGGRRFHFTDPSGNELAVWTPVLSR